MADTKNYRVTYADGTSTVLQLDDTDLKLWRKLAGDNRSNVKSVEPGEPQPFNAAGKKQG